jgi:hypothetical protein
MPRSHTIINKATNELGLVAFHSNLKTASKHAPWQVCKNGNNLKKIKIIDVLHHTCGINVGSANDGFEA